MIVLRLYSKKESKIKSLGRKIREMAGNRVENTISAAPTAPISTALVAAPIPGTGLIGTALAPSESKIMAPIAKKVPGFEKYIIKNANRLGKGTGKLIRGKGNEKNQF